MKVINRTVFKYPLTSVTVYAFDTGHQLDVHDNGRFWGFTPSHKICKTSVELRMVKVASQFEDTRIQIAD